MEFRLAYFFSQKIIAGPYGVPDPPSLAQMTFTQCTVLACLTQGLPLAAKFSNM